MPPGGSTRLTFTSQAQVIANHWAALAVDTATVQGVATFDVRNRNGTLVTTAGVLGLEAGNTFVLPVDVTRTASTGVAIANTTTNSVNVSLRLLGENGSQVAASTDTRLAPLGSHLQVADFVTTMFPQLTGTTFRGTLIVEAATGAPDNSLAVTALTVKEGLLSALPVIPITASETTTAPAAIDLTGTWSGIASDSSGPAQLTLQLTQVGTTVTGSSISVASGVVISGTLSGSLSGTTLTFTVNVPVGGVSALPGCSITLNGSATVTNTTMTGTYAGTGSCGSFTNGRFTATRL